MSDFFPTINGSTRAFVGPIAVATVTAVGGAAAGYYAGEHGTPPQAKVEHQYELWSPAAVYKDSSNLVVFKYDKITGQSWAFVVLKDEKGKETGKAVWALVADPLHTPVASPSQP